MAESAEQALREVYDEGVTWSEFWSAAASHDLSQDEASDLWQQFKDQDSDENDADNDIQSQREPEASDEDDASAEPTGSNEAPSGSSGNDTDQDGVKSFDVESWMDSSGSSSDDEDQDDDSSGRPSAPSSATDRMGTSINKLWAHVATLDLATDENVPEKEHKETRDEVLEAVQYADFGPALMNWVEEELLSSDLEDNPFNRLVMATLLAVTMTLSVRTDLIEKGVKKAKNRNNSSSGNSGTDTQDQDDNDDEEDENNGN